MQTVNDRGAAEQNARLVVVYDLFRSYCKFFWSLFVASSLHILSGNRQKSKPQDWSCDVLGDLICQKSASQGAY